MARGPLSSAARQLLILIDGRRTLGDLSNMLGAETLERSLEQLEAQGYVEVVRHFPELDESPGEVAASPPPAAEPTRSAVRRRSAMPVVIGILAASISFAALPPGGIIESMRPLLLVEPVAPPAPTTAGQDGTSAAPAGKALERPPHPPSEDHSSAPVHTEARAAKGSTREPLPSHAQQAAKPRLDVVATQVPSDSAPGADNVRPVLHVRSQITPQIPRQAKDLGIRSGHVVVILDVNPNGTVERVELVSATPPQVYDQQMQQTFEAWTFDPPGVTGRMTVQVDIVPPNEIATPPILGPASDDRKE